MSDPTQSTPPPTEQPGNGIPSPEQAPQPSGQPSQAAPTATPPPPSVEDLQAQLTQERQQREHFQQQYQSLQPEYTRARQALAQLAGANPQPPPANPVDKYAQAYMAKGFDEKQARAVAEVQYQIQQDQLAPLQQQIAVTQQATQVDYMLSQAQQIDPSVFQTPEAFNQVRQAAFSIVQNGGRATPEMLCSIANDYVYQQRLQNPQRQAQPTYQPPGQMPPQIFANGVNRMFPGFTPPPQPAAKPPLTPEAQAFEQHIKNRLAGK